MTLKLRDYQRDAVLALAENLVNKKTTDKGMLVMPTGAGKTFVASYFNIQLIRKFHCKIIWIAHRDELIKQAFKAHKKLAPDLKFTLWVSNKKDATGDVIFTSIQSTRGLADTLEGLYGPNSKNIVFVIDECHHFAVSDDPKYSNMYTQLYSSLKTSNMIAFCYGMTATPERLDGKRIGLDKIIYQLKYSDGIREGFLCRPMYYEMRTNQEYKLDEVRKDNGNRDFTDKDLAKLDNPIRNAKIAEEYVKHADWRKAPDGSFILDANGNKVPGWGKTIIFAVNVQHCYNLASEIKNLSPDIDLKVITGNSEDSERKELKDWLAEGDMYQPKVIINCLVFTEGFDEPTINTVFLTRPTKSEVLWMQMVGRGSRIIKDPITGEVLKDSFNLVSVMDEIGRYGALVKDWSNSIVDGSTESSLKLRKKKKKHIRAKRKLITTIEEHTGIEHMNMTEAQLIDVQAILVCASKYSSVEGIPLDQGRIDCLRSLKKFLESCCSIRQNQDGTNSYVMDLEAYRRSYSHCVPNNEFDHDTWRKISWAYYTNNVRRISSIRNPTTGKYQETWRIIPMVSRLDIDGDVAVTEADKRITEQKDDIELKNRDFNLNYGNREATKKLYQSILDMISSRGSPEASLLCSDKCVKMSAKDRVLEVKINCKVKEGSKELAMLNILNREGTSIMQDMLGDSSVEFIVLPIGV